jgi:phosphate transport system permease protein
LLGLAIFARALGDITGGRTVLTAALTMMLLILPVIIINAQEAIRAVPNTIREASYGLGATQWQTIWRQILPAALPGILTGMILSLSRAIGETAPLIVVGAAVFLSLDPTGPLSEFSVMPIQVFNWTKEADPQFRAVASAGIITLLVLLLTMNATAIILRNRFSRRLS